MSIILDLDILIDNHWFYSETSDNGPSHERTSLAGQPTFAARKVGELLKAGDGAGAGTGDAS